MSDKVDARIAEAMGWTLGAPGTKYGWPPGAGEDEEQLVPDFLSPEGFVALLEWHAKEGRGPLVRYGIAIQKWNGSLGDENGVVKASEHGPTPASALRAATVAWLDAKEGKR